jgi:hypothetical protein
MSRLFDRLNHESALPPLWRPKPSMVVHLEELPLLPTGKTDLLSLRALAKERLLGESATP